MRLPFVCIALIAVCCVLNAACTGEVNGVPEERSVPQGDVERGRTLIASYGCGSCHTIPGVAGADSMTGPPLMRFYQRTYIAGRLPNTLDNLIAWIQNPQEIDPGNAMPNLGISPTEARDIAAYLYRQTTTFELLNN